MFKDNKYTKWYFDIISKPQNDIYVENHHIIPKCMGGSNDDNNIIRLSARQHFLCHLLLIRMVDAPYKEKLAYAAWQFTMRKNKIKITARQYEQLKKELSISYIGRKRKPFSEKTRRNMSLSKLGIKRKPHTEESKLLISQNRKGKCIGEKNPFYGKTHSPETIEKIKIASSTKQKGRPKPKIKCKYCDKSVAANILSRFHNENCKSFLIRKQP